MKLEVFAVVLVALALTCDGCEYHRRLEAARRKQEAELRALQERLRQRGIEDAREGAYEEIRRSYAPSEDVSGSHHDHGSSSHRTSGIRRVVPSTGGSRYTSIRRVVPSTGGSRYTSTRRVVPVQGSLSHRSDPRVYPVPAQVNSLPAGNKFCPRSETYYCRIDQKCIYDNGIWKCRTETHSSITRYPIQGGDSYTRTRTSYNPRRVQQTFGPIHRTRYTCSSGMKRVNISASTFKCQDIDECETEANDCAQTCKNTYGSFYCQCERGYKRVGRNECIDRDECEDLEGICGRAATCENTEGSYECNCLEGYAEQDTGYCADINECEEANPCDPDEICFNMWGSHGCDTPKECPEGYYRPNGTEIQTQVCSREAESDDPDSPDTISYKKLLVEAKEYPDASKSLGSLTFSSANTDYDHSFSIRTLEGDENFWFRRKHTRRYGSLYAPARESSISIDFYNRKSLKPNVPLPFVLLITDNMTPRNHGYYSPYGSSSHYGGSSYYRNRDRRPRVITTKRKAVMEIFPMVHGSADEN